MTIRLMAWNIQNFGTASANYTLYKGTNSVHLANFIAGVINAYQIDVLMMMEVSQDAQASLNAVLAALNNGLATKEWCYDWIPCSVKEAIATTPPGSINSSDDLSWKGSFVSNRSEGYAVFWKNEQQAARFKMLGAAQNMSEGVRKDATYNPAYVPAHCISLSLNGRNYRTIRPVPYVQAESGFVQASYGDHWINAGYPDISSKGNPYLPRWERVRRPAWIAIEIVAAGGQANTVIPFVVYHAPSKRQLSRPGNYLNGLAQELYVLKTVTNNVPSGALFYHSKAVAAGDYNLDTRTGKDWRIYRTFYQPFGANATEWNSGANMTPLSTDARWVQTTVQVRQRVRGKPIGPQIQDNDINNYYHSVIDNIFHRGLTNPQTRRADLTAAVMNGSALTGAFISNFFNHIDRWRAIALARGGDVDPMLGPRFPVTRKRVRTLEPKFPNMINWQYFIAGLHQGNFTGNWNSETGGARSAAMFIHDFISDHLPVFVEFDIA
jgi:Endonuclease/Exonuclease/phosphatase family